jgi:hypothetical protein
MASIATRTLWLSISKLRNDSALYGHAMPFSMVSNCITGTGKQSGPICVFAHSVSVPISRGSPPISYD